MIYTLTFIAQVFSRGTARCSTFSGACDLTTSTSQVAWQMHDVVFGFLNIFGHIFALYILKVSKYSKWVKFKESKTKQNPKNKNTFKKPSKNKLRTCCLCLCLYRTSLLQSWPFLSWRPCNGSMCRDYLLRISEGYPHAPYFHTCTSLIVTICDIPSRESLQGKHSISHVPISNQHVLR